MTKLPLEIEIERAIAERDALKVQLTESDEENSQLLIQLNAERKLRAEIAADLRKISDTFNQLIALK